MLPGAGENSAGIGISYAIPLESGAMITARVDASYQDKIYFSEFNDEALSQDSVTKVNASVKFEDAEGRHYVTLWGKNITDEYVVSNITLGVPLWGLPMYGSIEAPATYGMTLGVSF
jgi:iron complex outermembrane receptor protein